MDTPTQFVTLNAHPSIPEDLRKTMEEEINKHLQPYQQAILEGLSKQQVETILWGKPKSND